MIDLPPNYRGYPEHDHADDGQDEVYVTHTGLAIGGNPDGSYAPPALSGLAEPDPMAH